MKLVREVTILTLLLAAGLLIQKLISFPSSLASMILFLVLLLTGILKVEYFDHGFSDLILKNLSFFFIPPTVKIIDSFDILQPIWVKLVLIMIISNILVMGITGRVVQFFLRKEKAHA